ncbi:MAG TPA: WD40 repeat domain-containing protein, partial [Gemmataceae bacterium]|nr:WD40 repeat domain-containing protein [Gemmataceae bacterium]
RVTEPTHQNQIDPKVIAPSKVSQLFSTLDGHTKAIQSLCFSPDGKKLASGGDDHVIKLWDIATGRITASLKGEYPYLWSTVAFNPDGKVLAIGGSLNKVKLWEIGTLKSTIILDEMKQCPETLVVFSPDGKTLVSGGICRSDMKLFDAATSKCTASLVPWKRFNPEGVLAMAFAPDGKTLISAGCPDEIKVWDTATGKNTATRNTAEEFSRTIAAISPDTKTLATTSYPDPGITLWEVATGKKIATLMGHTKNVGAVTFSPDSRSLASGYEDGTIKIWEVSSHREHATFQGHTGEVHCLAFSPDGKLMASGGDDKSIKIWNVVQAK